MSSLESRRWLPTTAVVTMGSRMHLTRTRAQASLQAHGPAAARMSHGRGVTDAGDAVSTSWTDGLQWATLSPMANDAFLPASVRSQPPHPAAAAVFRTPAEATTVAHDSIGRSEPREASPGAGLGDPRPALSRWENEGGSVRA